MFKNLAPRLVLSPREIVQTGLAGAFSGATAILCPPLGRFLGRTLSILATPPGLGEQLSGCPAADFAGAGRSGGPTAAGQEFRAHLRPVASGDPEQERVLALCRELNQPVGQLCGRVVGVARSTAFCRDDEQIGVDAQESGHRAQLAV